MSEHDGSSFRRQPAVIVSAAAIGLVTASIAAIVHPVAADATKPKYPSWNDVQQAKANVAEQQKMVDQISGLVNELQANATTAGIQSEIATESYHQAQAALETATEQAEDVQKQADAAQKTAQTSSVRAGLLASHLMRTAGTDGSLNLLLEGGKAGGAADRLLYQLGTMSQLTEQSRRIYDQAITDRNAAQALADQAKAAQKARKQAADAAKQASDSAQAAAAAAQAAVTEQQQKQGELTAQLASLKNESLQVAQQYVTGQQVAAAAKAAAEAQRRAAEKAAADKAAAAAAAAAAHHASSGSSGGSGGSNSSGGSGSGSGSNSGGASAPSQTSQPSAPSQPSRPSTARNTAPNQAIVNAAIAYARAQIGKPYVWDGAGPNGFDCSGLTMMAYAYAGVNIGGHGVVSQYEQGAALGQLIPRSEAEPGDLVMWGTVPDGLYHVGIYIGGGQMIAAPTVGEYVKQQAVWGSPIDVVVRPSMGR